MLKSQIYKIKTKVINKARIKSPWMMHFDATSCNGCGIEILACLTPKYDIERFGIVEKGNPRHSDILLVTGAVSYKMKDRLKLIYDQMPEPKIVIVVGVCGISKGIYQGCYNIIGPIDKVIPVDIYVPGCPPRPEAIIDGVIKGLTLWKAKLEKYDEKKENEKY
ncbi:MAG: NADH-quinone oxidoreductase subunit B family protein [DPANN group archaeon]|nr:NADH-quinone oxidoreductase subunit B family protein [DPANN group archaeon]